MILSINKFLCAAPTTRALYLKTGNLHASNNPDHCKPPGQLTGVFAPLSGQINQLLRYALSQPPCNIGNRRHSDCMTGV